MKSWFCGNVCEAQNEKEHQIILINNQTQQVIKFRNLGMEMKQKSLENGFIMIKKSIQDEYWKECQKNNKKFTDPQFPPDEKSLYPTIKSQKSQQNLKSILWKRIPQLYKNFQLIKDKIQPADVQQGNVGDCYFLSAISALAQNQHNILQIFQRKTPNLMLKNQLGLYKLIINKAGQPQQLVLDDFIPVFSKSLRPVFCKPVNNEFWVVLLEKAWAKINKSYGNISSGNPHDVLNRFSVAPVFHFNIPIKYYQNGQRVNFKEVSQFQQKIWNHIMQGHDQNFAMCCGSRSSVYSEGIKQSHSYTLLEAYQIKNNSKNRILKIRNPWGNTQYCGNLSENDSFWDTVNPTIKSKILGKTQNDGVFVMPFETFLVNFQSIDICHCHPKSYNYVFNSVHFQDSNIKFFQLFVKTQGQVYVTFEKQLSRNKISNVYNDNGVSKILIGQEIGDGSFEFIDCSLQTALADVTIRCKRLKKGAYIVMIQQEPSLIESKNVYQSKQQKNGTISAYSNTSCTISQISYIRTFLFDFFFTHAIKYNKEKIKIGAYQNDWIAKKLLQESGYGYICLNLDQKGSKRLEISINQILIQNQGFKLLYKPQTMAKFIDQNIEKITFQVLPGQSSIVLFKINFCKIDCKFSFPPQGFDIKKII